MSQPYPNAMRNLRHNLSNDQEYADTFHDNIAVNIADSLGQSHETSNIAASYIMKAIFGVTTKNPTER